MDEDKLLKIVGFNIKIERMKQMLTQAQLAEILNVHEKHICKIETGKQNMTLKTLDKIALALNVDAYTLLIKK